MKAVPELILASGSPRRAMLLRQMGFSFRVMPSHVPESFPENMSPESGVVELSERKARAVLERISEGIIIGADTVVVLDREILGKPRSGKEAVRMLERLSGRTHTVFTGFTLLMTDGASVADVERTEVTFRRLAGWEIEDYAGTGNPLDKAGGYGIQDRSGLFVESIKGCFYNVVGFPLTKFYQGLAVLIGSRRLRSMLKSENEMENIGRALKEAREKKKLSLQALFEKTRIPLMTLQAVENGELPDLPSAYLRAFIRTWARELDLDGETLLKALDEEEAARTETPDEAGSRPQPGHSVNRRLWIIAAAVLFILAAFYIRFGKTLFSEPAVPLPQTGGENADSTAGPGTRTRTGDSTGIPIKGPEDTEPSVLQPAASEMLTGSVDEETLYRQVPVFLSNKRAYQPDLNLLAKIQTLAPSLNVMVFFGSYDRLSRQIVPGLLRIRDELSLPDVRINLIGVDGSGRDPAGLTDLHRVRGIPTIILISRGHELGRIVGSAGDSLEKQFLEIANRIDSMQ